MLKEELQPMKRQIPLQEGWYHIPDSPSEKGYLIGTRCLDCNEEFFPRRIYCAACTSSNVEEKALSTRGKIDTFTISRLTPPGSIMEAPYVLAKVELPEGPLVTTVITDCDPEKVDIGMEVELVIQKVKEDDEGNDVMAYVFKPVGGLQ